MKSPDVNEHMFVMVVLEEIDLHQFVLQKCHLSGVQFPTGIWYVVLKTGHHSIETLAEGTRYVCQ